MTAREIGVGFGLRLEERRVLDDDLVGRVAMADPQLVGALLIPHHAALGAVDLHLQAVLAAGIHLAGGVGAAHAVAHAEHHRAHVLGIDRGLYVILRRKRLAGECLDRALGLLAGLMEGGHVGADAGDALSGDVLRHVAPVGADIGQAARTAVELAVEAPVPVGIVE